MDSNDPAFNADIQASNQEPATATSPSQSIATQGPLKPRRPVHIALILVVAVVAASLSAALTYVVVHRAGQKNEASLKAKLTALTDPHYKLPAGSMSMSECVPSMGIHNMTKDGNPEYGPFILTSKAGKVLGIEYMASEDMYTNIPNTNPPVSLVEKDSPAYGWKIDHIEISHTTAGQGGMGGKGRIDDIHLYTVGMQEAMDACK